MDLKKSALAWVQAVLTQWQESDAPPAPGQRRGPPKKRRSAVAMGLSKKPKPSRKKPPVRAQPAPM